MADREQLYNALRNADAAGDVEAARKLAAYIQSMPQDDAPALQQPAAREPRGFLRSAGDALAGAVRGAGSIGATLLAPVDIANDALAGKGFSLESNRQRRADMDAALSTLGADTDSLAFKGGKLAGEIAGTAGAGGAVANVAGRGIGAVAPSLLPKAQPLLAAIQSGGMTAGGAGMGTRMAGGAIAGGVQAAMVDPSETVTGAAIGGAAPGVFKLAGKLGSGVGAAWRSATAPEKVKIAQRIAAQSGASVDEVVAALSQQGPEMLPGYQRTVPQILQTPELSQLQRTLKTAGSNALGDAERVQQEAYRAALNRVAPVDLTVNDAAARAGDAIKAYAVPAREAAGEKVRAAFEAVDPFNESALLLPLDDMQRASAKYLGEGTFGTGSRAAQALDTARQVGTQELPAVRATTQAAAGRGQTLEQAVRSAGGIKGRTGELRDLGIRQSGTTGLINNKTGQSVDLLAEEMYRRGFIAEADPDLLIDTLRNGGGRNVFAADLPDSVFARQFEQAMGDLPGVETIQKTVPFQTVQNLRSSIGEAAEQASAKGANKEAAALRQMVDSIDQRVNRAAGGMADPSEYFPRDMGEQYRAALRMHADKMRKFETGPQIGMFRKGADGQAAIQGAEIPGKFFSGRASQVEDMQAFKRLAGDVPNLMQEMKRFAITEGANTSNASGELTQKFIDWAKSRSGASRELFSPNELATVREVGKAVERAIKTEGLGRVTGSDTAQKLASLQSLGLLDNRVVDVLANRIPVVGSFTGPALSSLRNAAAQKRNTLMAGLLANPEEMAAALRAAQRPTGGLMDAALERAMPLTYRAAPVGLLGFHGQ